MTRVRRGCNRNASRRTDRRILLPSLPIKSFLFCTEFFLPTFMHKFLSIHFEQHIDNAQLLKINKSHVLQIKEFLVVISPVNCNKITTCTSTDKWLKQLLVDLSFFSWFRSLYYLCIEKGTLRRGMYRDPPSSRLVNFSVL